MIVRCENRCLGWKNPKSERERERELNIPTRDCTCIPEICLLLMGFSFGFRKIVAPVVNEPSVCPFSVHIFLSSLCIFSVSVFNSHLSVFYLSFSVFDVAPVIFKSPTLLNFWIVFDFETLFDHTHWIHTTCFNRLVNWCARLDDLRWIWKWFSIFACQFNEYDEDSIENKIELKTAPTNNTQI